jgi:hypothetical protein
MVMPRFHFHLRANGAIQRDQQGTELPNQAAAREYASTVARELMLHSGFRTCHWSLRAENEKAEAQFDLYFADVDPRLGACSAKVRTTASETCRRIGALTDVLCAARETLVESRLLLARTQGRPQLVYAKRN